MADELVNTGKATHALIGIQVPSQDDVNGARAVEVTAGGPADKAGIPKGAVVTKVDDRSSTAPTHSLPRSGRKAPGDKVIVTLPDAGGGKPKTVQVTLGNAADGGVMRSMRPMSELGYTVRHPWKRVLELVVGRALVVVVDDRTAHGDEDHSGPLVTELLDRGGIRRRRVVAVAADEVEIRNALNTAVIGGVDLVVSVGGTGVTPRDVTPEATRDMLDREILGIAEAMPLPRGSSAGIIDAGLSRGLAGVSGSTFVVNLAGSRYAVRDGMATLNPLASHVIGELSGLTE